MAEAAILGMIQHLESSYANSWDNSELRIKELRGVLDFLSDLKLEERRRTKYLMADLLDLAQDLADNMFILGRLFLVYQNEIKSTKMRIINFGANDKNDTEEEDEEVVVGLEKDVRKLIDKVLLNDFCKDKNWIIKGMTGIGKTTLARQVYNHKDVVGWFEHRAWVSISSDKSNKEILVDLIQQMMVDSGELIDRDYLLEEKDNQSLQKMLGKHLQGKRFLMVFDNMLKGMRLSYILRHAEGIDEYSIHYQDCGSRMLSTSRYASPLFARYHNMKTLDSDKSWQLFLKTIDKFTSEENKFSKELERKGKEMLKKCGGLPMAIVDVARQKAKQRLSGIEWEELFDSIDLDKTLKMLEPMYDELDKNLKACFLHMSLFKENAIMREEKLEHIWFVTGLISRTTLEERNYGEKGRCADLLSESIIEAVKEIPHQHDLKKCRMNPLLHMLSIKKAEEEIGFEIVKNSQPSQNRSHRVIHRVIHCGREKFNHSTNQDSKELISLIFHGGGGYLEDVSSSYWESFELLKILDLEDFGVKTMSESIGNLSELRYLGLRNNYLTRIPRSLGDLENLEVLDIYLNFMVEVPDSIGEMGSLRNIYMSDVIFPHPLKIDTLQNLETLTKVSIYDWAEVSSLGTLNYLEKLGIEDVDENLDVGKFFASLAKLKRLQHLTLRGSRFRSMPCLEKIGVLRRLRKLRLDGRLDRLPRASNIPEGIRDLVLVNTCLEEDPMPVLEKLPGLKRLRLWNAFTGREMVIQNEGFEGLRSLSINELWNLRNIKVAKDAIWCLDELEIMNCPHLETLPEEDGSMKYLEQFKMVTTKHIATKIRASGLTSKIVEVDIVP